MKIIGKTENAYLAEITGDEIAIVLGFRSTYDDAYKEWSRQKTRYAESTLPVGTVVEVREISAFWTAIQWKEGEATKAAENLRALAALITTNLPRGIVPPVSPEGE